MQTQLSQSSIAERNSQYYTSIYPIPYHYGSLDGYKGRGKFLFDSLLAIISVLFLWPLFIGISLAIKLDSSGPIFCRRRVLGRNGRIFYAYSFRTTHVHGRQKTRVGQSLCKLGLAELPLLFNVIKHELSFVGPRFVTPDQIVAFGSHAEQLLTITPGITGQWQINGRQPEKRLEQDMEYINNHSIVGDVNILLQTFTAVFKKRK